MADSLSGVILQIATATPPALATLNPALPDALELVISRCLEKRRDNRYPNVAEFALALADFAPKRARSSVDRTLRVIQAAGLSVSALSAPPSSARGVDGAEVSVATAGAIGTQAAFGNTNAPPKLSSRKVLVVGLLGAALVAVAVARQHAPSTAVAEPVSPASAPVVAVSALPASQPQLIPAASPQPVPTLVDSVGVKTAANTLPGARLKPVTKSAPGAQLKPAAKSAAIMNAKPAKQESERPL